tara:strand:+ start:36978 stop:37190 length:213 start_codon:yes stop_codon:yes gene_type:complete
MKISISNLRNIVREELLEIEKIQKIWRNKHPKMKSRILNRGANKDTGGGEGIETHANPTRAKSAPAGAGR